MYTLTYPNEEIKRSIAILMVGILTAQEKKPIESALFRLKMALYRHDIDTFCTIIQQLFAALPYHLHIQKEAYYHSLLQFLMYLMGFEVQSEIATSTGRIDLVIKTTQRIYVFEFKLDQASQKALDQIEERRYHEQYLAARKPLTLIGISFNYQDKAVSLEWVKKELSCS